MDILTESVTGVAQVAGVLCILFIGWVAATAFILAAVVGPLERRWGYNSNTPGQQPMWSELLGLSAFLVGASIHIAEMWFFGTICGGKWFLYGPLLFTTIFGIAALVIKITHDNRAMKRSQSQISGNG